jgi:hypothetical protein
LRRRLIPHWLRCDWGPWDAPEPGEQIITTLGVRQVYDTQIQKRFCRVCNKRRIRQAS